MQLEKRAAYVECISDNAEEAVADIRQRVVFQLCS
jgi:hypothetical protein